MQDHIKKVVDDIVQTARLSPKESNELRHELLNHCDLRSKELGAVRHSPEKINAVLDRSFGDRHRIGNEFVVINYDRFLISLGAVSLLLMLLAFVSAFVVWWVVIRSL